MGYSQQVKEDAAKAAEVLRTRGWCQNETEDEKGRCCAIGAISVATDGRQPDRNALIIAARKESGCQYLAVDFNDREGQTAEGVIELFDRIANS